MSSPAEKGEECNSANRSHPTQKPVAILEYLIKTYTLENETVLDFTMGSGSTGVACVNLNRKFWGIEKNKEYYDIAVDRIEKAKHEYTQQKMKLTYETDKRKAPSDEQGSDGDWAKNLGSRYFR